MKVNYFLIVVLILLLNLNNSCKKDKDEPDYVTGYVPTLTEAAGKTYTGEYFPFDTGYSWYWNGEATITGSMEITASGKKQTEPLNESSAVSAYLLVNSPVTLTLPSGNYNVYPTSEGVNTVRYFMKTDSSLLIKALNYNGTITEVVNPVYIRKPLVVGQSWASTPTVDFKQIVESKGFAASGEEVDIKCALFVLGKEDFYWNGQNHETVKLQERARATGSINVDYMGMTGPMNFDIKMDTKLLLLKDVGIVRQYGTMEINMTGNLIFVEIGVKVKMVMKQDMDVTLDTYDVSLSNSDIKNPELKSKISNTHNIISPNTANAINKFVQKIANSVLEAK